MKLFWIGLLSSTLTLNTWAQPGPPDGGDGPPPPADHQDGPPPGGGQGGPGGNQRGPGQNGQNGPGGQNQGQNRPNGMRPPNDPLGRMLNYLEIVERYSKITKDGTTAGVAAVVAATDLLRPAGNAASIEFFTKMLEETKNASVKRAIRLQLVDLYRLTGDRDKALEQLKILMTEAPAGEDAK